MKVIITTVALGGWYPRGAGRMIREFQRLMPGAGYELRPWINELPPGAPANVIEGGWDYTGYCAKPFALQDALYAGADVALLLDAAFWPIRSIAPLVKHIAETGYYLCDNGYRVGEWVSDRALETLGLDREPLMSLTECSSYAVGISRNCRAALNVANEWAKMAAVEGLFAGPHTAPWLHGRNVGFVSTDSRVRGFRHDQSILAVLAHSHGTTDFTPRPIFTNYQAEHGARTNEKTVLLNAGMG